MLFQKRQRSVCEELRKYIVGTDRCDLVHKYKYATDKSTRSILIKKLKSGSSRYVPYEFDLSVRPRNKKSKNQENIIQIKQGLMEKHMWSLVFLLLTLTLIPSQQLKQNMCWKTDSTQETVV